MKLKVKNFFMSKKGVIISSIVFVFIVTCIVLITFGMNNETSKNSQDLSKQDLNSGSSEVTDTKTDNQPAKIEDKNEFQETKKEDQQENETNKIVGPDIIEEKNNEKENSIPEKSPTQKTAPSPKTSTTEKETPKVSQESNQWQDDPLAGKTDWDAIGKEFENIKDWKEVGKRNIGDGTGAYWVTEIPEGE